MKVVHDYECNTYAKIKKNYGIHIPWISLADIGTGKPWSITVNGTRVLLHSFKKRKEAQNETHL